MAELEIITKIVGLVPTIHLEGDFDSYSAPRVRALLEKFTTVEKQALLIDMTGVDYVDSAGLGVLVSALKQVTDHSGALGLISPGPAVARVLRVTGLDTLFQIFTDESEAQQKLHLAAT